MYLCLSLPQRAVKASYELWYDHKIPTLYETNALPMPTKEVNHINTLCGYTGVIKLNVIAVNSEYREQNYSANLVTLKLP